MTEEERQTELNKLREKYGEDVPVGIMLEEIEYHRHRNEVALACLRKEDRDLILNAMRGRGKRNEWES